MKMMIKEIKEKMMIIKMTIVIMMIKTIMVNIMINDDMTDIDKNDVCKQYYFIYLYKIIKNVVISFSVILTVK